MAGMLKESAVMAITANELDTGTSPYNGSMDALEAADSRKTNLSGTYQI